MLHLAWCFAVSAAATRWRTGSQTIDWGSKRIQSRKTEASSSGLLLAFISERKKINAGNAEKMLPKCIFYMAALQWLLTNWKQLRTLGSILLPPKDATSPSCLGIWMASCRRRPRRRWSQKPVALATSRNKTREYRKTLQWRQVTETESQNYNIFCFMNPEFCLYRHSEVY